MIKIDNATLYNQDCLEFLKTLQDESVNCFLIDEPYGILTGHKIEQGYNLDIAKQVRLEAMRVLKKDGWFIFFSQFPNAWDFGRITMEVGFKPWQQCNEIIWCKRTASNVFGKIGRIHENIFVFQKGSPQIYENKAPYEDIAIDNVFYGIATLESIKKGFACLKQGKIGNVILPKKSNDKIYKIKQIKENYDYYNETRLTSIFSFIPENKIYKNNHNIKHPTTKPTLLLRRLLKLFTQQGDVVLDCFNGSGTTAIACLQEGRQFIGCERDKTYFDNSIERLKNWKADLERQDEWLEKRGVKDFKSDIEVKKETKNKTLF